MFIWADALVPVLMSGVLPPENVALTEDLIKITGCSMADVVTVEME